MTFNDIITTRYSVRTYSDRPVEEEKIQAILESARLAPTAKNSQPQKIYVAKTKTALEKMDLVTPNRFGAPVVMLICGDTEKACILKSNGRNFLEVDATIVQSFMMLKATELGLGSCWIGRYTAEKVHEVFDIPKTHVPYGILLIGYKAEDCVPGKMHFESISVDDFTTTL